MPDCLGHYEVGDVQCDGPPGPPSKSPACGWRNVCRRYREACRLRGGVDPAVERAMLSQHQFFEFVLGLQVHANDNLAQSRALRAWDRFLAAFCDALPALAVHADIASALPGELYVDTWHQYAKAAPEGRVRCKLLKLRLGGPGSPPSSDVSLVKFWPTFTRKVLPTIEMRAKLETVLELHPGVRQMAARFATYGHQSHCGLGFGAVNVLPEHVGDMGRLWAALLAGGHATHVHIVSSGSWLRYHGREVRGSAAKSRRGRR